MPVHAHKIGKQPLRRTTLMFVHGGLKDASESIKNSFPEGDHLNSAFVSA
jgi:hypothetical protein